MSSAAEPISSCDMWRFVLSEGPARTFRHQQPARRCAMEEIGDVCGHWESNNGSPPNLLFLLFVFLSQKIVVNSISPNHRQPNGQSDGPQHSAEKGYSAESPSQPNTSAQPNYSAGSYFSRILRLSQVLRLQSVPFLKPVAQ